MLHLIPTGAERKKLFYWLHKSSSYTAFERVGRYYKRWVDAFQRLYEDTQRNPDARFGELMSDDEFILVLTGYACFEEALSRLKAGNKRPFVWLGQTGHFSEAALIVTYWNDAVDKAESGDIEVEEMSSPHWPQVKNAHAELTRVWGEIGIVQQTRFTDLPAQVSCVEDLHRCRFPNFELPDVPEPKVNVLVRTGAVVSQFGIWEPVKVDITEGFVGIFKRPKAPADGTFEIDGCMNYLHQGAAAPTVFVENDGQRGEGRATVWRLIWEDKRYVDGLIPADEQDYVFIDPTAAAVRPTPAAPSSNDPLIRASSGDVSDKSGTWAVVDDLHGRVSVKAGDRLPLHNGRNVLWVWVNF